ncbi:DUF423 domain-containing protein [Luteimonas viscosa]|uniref:DUF423 domain-containing protein n=1 Tax=Luteimonas viscosa TaxID=1132694 RepID=A0A5D4XLA8_9GAMM|nr:DUF423 domain-containing protein [Luteimonas viscosa]TYT25478.1 DUF423 domain-containing protein [Luteimonas viscosa]
MSPAPARVPAVRWLRAAGALLAAVAVGLSAYAAHGIEAPARANLQLAALYAFGHGVALAALARGGASRLALGALWLLLAGTVLFAGALVSKSLLGWSAATAPLGGGLLILGWLLLAASAARD